MNIGIIGTGRIARRFVPEWMAADCGNITAVYNPHKGSAWRFADAVWQQAYGKRPSCHDDIDEIWEHADAVYIASPHETHIGYIAEALAHGKHVLCEKPLALSRAEAEQLYGDAERRKLVLLEGIKTAWCPGYLKLQEVATSGIIGDIRYLEACFTKLEDPASRELTDINYGGSFTELGSYVLLPALDLLGTGCREIRFDSIVGENGLDLLTCADIRYDNAMAHLTCGLGVKSEGRLLIAGTKGYLNVSAPWWKTTRMEVHFEDPSRTEVYEVPFEGDGLRYEIRHFLALTEHAHMEKTSVYRERSTEAARIMETFLQQQRDLPKANMQGDK